MALAAVQVGVGWLGEDSDSVNRYFYELLESLNDHGVDSRGLVVGSNAADLETDGAIRSFSSANEPVLRRWKGLRLAARRAWATLPPDQDRLLVTHHAVNCYPLIKEWGDSPWVMHCHKPWSAGGQGGRLAKMVKRRLERQAYRRADAILVTSNFYRNWVCREFDVAEDRVHVVSGAIDCDRFVPASSLDRELARKQLGWPTDRPTVLCVRKLTEGFGLNVMIDAIQQVRRQIPDILCMIAGRGPLAEQLVSRIDAAGLAPAVVLAGVVPDEDLPVAYRAADVSVVPAERPEEFVSGAVESLASGTPCLVTPAGGLPEIVSELSPRLVCAEPTAKSLADAITLAITQRSTLPDPDHCQSYARQHFDWNVITPKIIDVYEAAVRSASNRPR